MIGKKICRLRLAPLLAAPCAVAVGVLAGPASLAFASGGLAGYNLSATATAIQFQLNSRGLLPVGEATTGNIFEADFPFARSTASSGPQVDALASPLYPGDTAAHLGTAVATFGGPELPNDPVVADAQYPPTPTNTSTESFSVPPLQNGAFSLGPATAQSHASPDGATVSSAVGEASAGPAVAGAANLVEVKSSRVSNEVKIASDVVTATATSTATGIDIASVVQISDVEGTATGKSDGSNGVPGAGLRIGNVTVAGQPAYIDQDGIHLADQNQGGSAVAFANAALLNLADNGITIHTLAPTQTTNGNQASADSGAVEVSLTGHTPNVPGTPPLAGAVPVPGAPSVPFQVNILLGNASASADASALPTFPDVSAPTDLGTLAAAGAQGDVVGMTPAPTDSFSSAVEAAGVQAAAPVPAVAGDTQTLAPTGPGSSSGAAQRLGGVTLASVSHPIPVGLAVVVLLAAVIASGGLLAYARWQLINGRRR